MFNNGTKEILDGCYHTSTFELTTKKIIESKKNFNQYIILDQPQEKYSHPSLFNKMFHFSMFCNASFNLIVKFVLIKPRIILSNFPQM